MTNKVSLPFRWPVRVYYEDTDAAGVVYYANYLKFLERGRTELLRALGFEILDLHEAGAIFPVREVHARYLAPARLGERLEVCTHAVRVEGVALHFEASVTRDDVVLLTSRVQCVCVDPQGRPRRLPTELKARLAGV